MMMILSPVSVIYMKERYMLTAIRSTYILLPNRCKCTSFHLRINRITILCLAQGESAIIQTTLDTSSYTPTIWPIP